MARGPINQHRGLGQGDLPRSYLRRDEHAHPDELEADEASVASYDDYYDYEDDYWQRSSATADDFLLHRLSTEVLWTIVPRPPRWRGELGEIAPTDAAVPVVELDPDALPEILHEHLRCVDSPAALNSYLETDTARAALAELSSAQRAHPGLARWFAERSGPAFLIVLLAPFWIRRPGAWVAPDDGRVDAIGRALVEHLFVRFPVAEALYEPWRTTAWPVLKWVTWLILIGQGASLRRAAARFGWDIVGTFAHHLSQAPPRLRPAEAAMWAEVRRLGGNDTDFRRLVAHPAFVIDPTIGGPSLPGAEPVGPEAGQQVQFWRATTDWMIRHRDELAEPAVHGVLDWAMHRRTEDLAREVPEADRFVWRGRTATAVLAAAREYAELVMSRYRRTRAHVSWPARGWDWAAPTPAAGEGLQWTVHELNSTAQLVEESATMSHCVATYEWRCAQRLSAIFSLRFGGARRATIELEPTSRRVVQARGLRNRACTAEELAVIARWLVATDPARSPT